MSSGAYDLPALIIPPSFHVVNDVPALCGLPLKYVSLVTLAVQNAALTLIMHTSRIVTPPSQQYSAASAVLLNELLKGSISCAIAFSRIDTTTSYSPRRPSTPPSSRTRRLAREIFSTDCWKLSVPAVLYVVQNNLQYVAASNLDAATFQVTYQMKILTTAAFSVILLRRQLTRVKWIALVLLAVGVGIVQIQSNGTEESVLDPDVNPMHPLRGFLAVTAACFTSGLAGVYFEMVLKNSQSDLWVRNVQLSLFSLPPALLPALAEAADYSDPTSDLRPSLLHALLRNFGPWAWATVFTQVLGGLLTALVIKHADNILKGFATALSIILAAIASVLLFGFKVSPAFVGGASIVLGATWMYNCPAPGVSSDTADATANEKKPRVRIPLARVSRPPSALTSPVTPSSPILGQAEPDKKRLSARVMATALGLTYATHEHAPETVNDPIEHPLYTPPPSRPPSPLPPPPTTSRLGVSSPYLQSRTGSSASLHSDIER